MRAVRLDWVFVVLLLSAAWPGGTPQATAQSDGWIITDPADDAYEGSARDLAREPHDTCAYTLGMGFETCEPLFPPAGLPEQGIPAPPSLDIVALRLEETPMDLVVTLEVASLADDLSDAMLDDGGGMGWAVCWNSSVGCVQVAVYPRNDGTERFSYLLAYGAPSCGADLPFCLSPATVAFEAGAPGRVIWTVPRVLLANGDSGEQLENVTAYTDSFDSGQWTSWSIASPLRSRSGSEFGRFWLVDYATEGTGFTFESASTSRLEDVASVEHSDQAGEAAFPDADIQRVVYVENETTFTLALQMGRVAGSSPALTLGGVLSFTTGPSFVVTVERDEGRLDGTVVMCGDETCSYQIPAPALVTPSDGAPGWINVTFDRADLGDPPAGTRVAAALFGTETSETTAVDEPALEAQVSRSAAADLAALGPVYAFLSDSVSTGQGPGEGAVIIHDPAGDATSDQPAVDTTSGVFDLVLAGVEGTSPTSSRVTIGVRDLSRLAVPAGAKAIAYSVAVETDAGATMVGFYRDASRGEFFCSSDTLVLPEEKKDPAEAAWTRLDGVLSLARSGANAVGGDLAAPSTLTIFVPHSCFGTQTPGTIAGHSLTAAIHVIPQEPIAGVPLQRIETVDEAHDESVTAFTLGTAVPEAAVAPWYARPFGIDGFWDITGIALAVLLPLVGLFAVRRRHGLLRRYMTQIDRALSDHAGQAKARETALQGIRRRLGEDAMRGRISNAHFLLVDARLAENLKETRVHELTVAFGDLPHRLLQKLVEILADGTITSEEARRFGALLEDSDLTKHARERIRRKVALWVADDASQASTA